LSFRSESTEGPESAEKAVLQALVDDVRKEWGQLWSNRIDDKVRAEGVANRDYLLLFVERGTVIVATRDFKPLDFKEILRTHKVWNAEQIVPPHPSMGGWGKFARTMLNKQRRARKWQGSVSCRTRKENLQPKKGGRGWLHCHMNK